jgi:hypothetical protein
MPLLKPGLTSNSDDIHEMFAEVLQKLFGLIQKQVERTTPIDGSPAPMRVSRISVTPDAC